MFKKKYIGFIGLFLLFLYKFLLCDVQIKLQDKFEQCLKNKKIILCFNLDGNHAVLKEHIFFYLDTTILKIEKIEYDLEPTIEYIPSFRNNHKLYFRSFAAKLNLSCLKNDFKNLDKTFKQNHMLVSFFVLDKNGKTYPKSILLNLKDDFLPEDKEIVLDRKLSQTSDYFESNFSMSENFLGSEDNKFVKEKRVEKVQKDSVMFKMNWKTFVWLDLFLFVVSIFLFIPKKNNKNYIFDFICGTIFFVCAFILLIKICLIFEFLSI